MNRLFLFLFCALCIFFADSLKAEDTELISYSGTVEVLLKDADEYSGVEEGMLLSSGDKIKTGDSSSAELSFNSANTNVVRLEDNTEVKVSLSADEKLEMAVGEVFSSVGELSEDSAFEIRTPTAVSGARGTQWVTKVSDEGTEVEAVNDVPYVRHYEADGKLSQERTMIGAGQMTKVRRFQKPEQLRPMAMERRQKFAALGKEVHKRAGEAVFKRQQRPQFKREDFLDKIKEKKENRSRGSNGGAGKLDSSAFKGADNTPGKRVFDSAGRIDSGHKRAEPGAERKAFGDKDGLREHRPEGAPRGDRSEGLREKASDKRGQISERPGHKAAGSGQPDKGRGGAPGPRRGVGQGKGQAGNKRR